MNGKAIYQPPGAAGEYAKYACNFYIGCSNQCEYCYCNRFKWGNVPKLKACFKNSPECALQTFEKELEANLPELQKYGLFFSFSTDPMIANATIYLTGRAVACCVHNAIPVKILTKRADWLDYHSYFTDFYCLESEKILVKKYVAFGFTLTGHDEKEPHASTNAERIEAMRKLHEAGFKTWASIEPVIDFESSLNMILATKDFCDLYKIGLQSGKKYDKDDLLDFVDDVIAKCSLRPTSKIYFKDSLLKQAGIERESLPANCVSREYNMFNS